MNKTQFIKKVKAGQRVDGNPETTEELVNLMFETLKETLLSGEQVTITNFGSFGIKEQEERLFKVPNTDRTVLKPKRKTLTFKFSKNFKTEFEKRS